jgi:hypothetical protein
VCLRAQAGVVVEGADRDPHGFGQRFEAEEKVGTAILTEATEDRFGGAKVAHLLFTRYEPEAGLLGTGEGRERGAMSLAAP